MNAVINRLTRYGLLQEDLDYHLLRASMVVIFAFFGYQKWFEYEAQVLIPYISHGPLIFWMYPVFGIRGASWFLGVAEWLFGALLFLGFWDKRLGVLGALGSTVTFLGTVTIIPFMPNGWAPSAGGFPAMAGNVPFLMKDVVLLAVSIYLLKQDILRLQPVPARSGIRLLKHRQPEQTRSCQSAFCDFSEDDSGAQCTAKLAGVPDTFATSFRHLHYRHSNVCSDTDTQGSSDT
jgi:uncharacterized membrane protein YkgB